MPFTLAHPAAILPLRRLCPRALNLSALVMGSLVPDVGYFFARWKVDEYSHAVVGSAVFGLPVGALMVGVLYALRAKVVEHLPLRHRILLAPLCRRAAGSLWTIAISLLIGIWTHLVLDSFTHKGGWLVEEVPLLQQPVITVKYHNFRVHHLLWYGFSFVGVAWVCFAYDRWMRTAAPDGTDTPSNASWQNALLIAGMLLPIELFHHSYGGLVGMVVVAVLSSVTVVVAVWRLGR